PLLCMRGQIGTRPGSTRLISTILRHCLERSGSEGGAVMSVEDFERVFGTRTQGTEGTESTVSADDSADTASSRALDPRDVGRRFAGLPMPRNVDLLRSEAGRPRVLRGGHKRFPFPVPNGWFIVARADELQPGEVMPLYLFARHLVLFRTESG